MKNVAISIKIIRNKIVALIIGTLIIAIPAIVSAVISKEKPVITSDYFPLAVGNRWVYKGIVMDTIDRGRLIKKKIYLTMSVDDVIKNKDMALYILTGDFKDSVLGLREDDEDIINTPSNKYGYLLVSNKIFYIQQDKLEKAIDCIKNIGYLKDDMVRQKDLIFEFPLFKGQKFGETSQIAREDMRYFWHVDKVGYYKKDSPEYQLIYNTLPDSTEIKFQPYLGILSYRYHHHGTKIEANLSLIDYKI